MRNCLIICLLVGAAAYAFIVWKSKRGLLEADAIYLAATYSRWQEAGSPRGTNMSLFLTGRKESLIEHTNVYVLGTNSFHGVLALTNLMSYHGSLIISAEGIVLLKEADKVSIVRRSD